MHADLVIWDDKGDNNHNDRDFQIDIYHILRKSTQLFSAICHINASPSYMYVADFSIFQSQQRCTLHTHHDNESVVSGMYAHYTCLCIVRLMSLISLVIYLSSGGTRRSKLSSFARFWKSC